MKFTKMSLVAALLIGSSAFALDNVKMSGDAKLFYSTSDADDADLFHKDGSIGQAAVDLGLTAEVIPGVTVGASTQALTTLGLENNLVSGVWAGSSVQTQWWFSEMYLAATLGNTTAKVGRQTLDTPFAFTETWNIASNTFDAAVLLNTDLPDTTLVGAWVGKHNSAPGFAVVASPVDAAGAQTDSFNTFGLKGAYAAGVVNNSVKPLTVQAWYYDVVSVADAAWVQADVAMEGFTVGAQYAAIMTKSATEAFEDSSAFALKAGYAIDAFSISGAFSQTDPDGVLQIVNVATMDLSTGGGGAQSKLYTEAWWNFGYVGAPDTTAINVTANYDAGFAGFGAYVTTSSADEADLDMMEVTLEATKSFGPLDTSLVYVMTEADDQNEGDAYNMIQAYLTLNF